MRLFVRLLWIALLFVGCTDNSSVVDYTNTDSRDTVAATPMVQWVGEWTEVILDRNGQLVLGGYFPDRFTFYPTTPYVFNTNGTWKNGRRWGVYQVFEDEFVLSSTVRLNKFTLRGSWSKVGNTLTIIPHTGSPIMLKRGADLNGIDTPEPPEPEEEG